MQGQMLFRATGQKSKSGKAVYIILGVVGIDKNEVKDGFKYDVLDIAINNAEDFTEYDMESPEDIFEEEIWRVK